jgi:AraC-like DNA-binding protein
LGQIAAAIDRGNGQLRREVVQSLEVMLPSGDVSIERIAGELGLSRQTLYRRLKAEGVTFEQLLDELRHRVALKLLREQHLPVKQAAWRLGFSDPAAFSRAFKRWTGTNPSLAR